MSLVTVHRGRAEERSGGDEAEQLPECTPSPTQGPSSLGGLLLFLAATSVSLPLMELAPEGRAPLIAVCTAWPCWKPTFLFNNFISFHIFFIEVELIYDII